MATSEWTTLWSSRGVCNATNECIKCNVNDSVACWVMRYSPVVDLSKLHCGVLGGAEGDVFVYELNTCFFWCREVSGPSPHLRFSCCWTSHSSMFKICMMWISYGEGHDRDWRAEAIGLVLWYTGLTIPKWRLRKRNSRGLVLELCFYFSSIIFPRLCTACASAKV